MGKGHLIKALLSKFILLQVTDWTNHVEECKATRKEYFRYKLEWRDNPDGKDIGIGNMFDPGRVGVLRPKTDGRLEGRQHFVVQVSICKGWAERWYPGLVNFVLPVARHLPLVP